MQTLFTYLTNAIQSTPALALIAALIWGILSILLSPCHLTSIPLIIGFISGQGTTTTRRAFGLSMVFALGILLTIALIGVITAMLGRMLGDLGSWGNYCVALIFFVVGLYLMDIISLPFLTGVNQPQVQRRGLWAALTLGLVFGLALGPCTFAYMAPILAITFDVASRNFIYGLFLLLVYGLGHISVIVLAGTFTNVLQRYLHWTESSSGARIAKKICGFLVILGGIYLIYKA